MRDIVHQFCPSLEKYQRIMEAMDHEMEAGLKKATNPTSTIKMFPSYVTQLPNGTVEEAPARPNANQPQPIAHAALSLTP